MTRDQQIKFALDLLASARAGINRTKCRTDIARMLDIINEVMADDGTLSNSKGTKAKVDRLIRALDEVQAAYNGLPPRLKLEVFKSPDQKSQESLVAACKLFKNKSLKRPAERQRLAASAAQGLLNDYGIPRTTTRGRPWHRLAAILYGDGHADLYAYLRELKDVDDIL